MFRDIFIGLHLTKVTRYDVEKAEERREAVQRKYPDGLEGDDSSKWDLNRKNYNRQMRAINREMNLRERLNSAQG